MHTMNKMVIAICVVQMLSTTSIALYHILTFTNRFDDNIAWVVQLLTLMNHVMNPILFFYFTSCRRAFNSKGTKRAHKHQQHDTQM